MLNKSIRIIAILLTALATCIIVPRFFRMLFSTHSNYKDVVYSEVLNDFIISEYEYKNINGKISGITIYKDSKGNRYTREQADSLCPLNNASQLTYDGKFPDSICGKNISAKDADDAIFHMNIAGRYNELFYGLSELKDQKSYLSNKYEPKDLFRIKENGIEFIVSSTNTIDEKKSKLFNSELEQLGFTAPAITWWSPADRTDFEKIGYFVLDSKGELFRLSMNDGRPDILRLNRPDKKKILNINFSNRPEFLAIIITEDGNSYVMDRNFNYQALPLPSLRRGAFLQGNLMHLTFTTHEKEATAYYILDKNYKLIKQLTIGDKKVASLQETIGSYLFPVKISQNANYGIQFHFSNPFHFIWLNIVLALATFFIKKRNGYPINDAFAIIDIIVVLVLGIFGMAGVFAIPQRKSKQI